MGFQPKGHPWNQQDGLSEEVLQAIDKLGFEQAAPIQAAAIPVLMKGHRLNKPMAKPKQPARLKRSV
jgi:superfamily II DNA/RNA helicase